MEWVCKLCASGCLEGQEEGGPPRGGSQVSTGSHRHSLSYATQETNFTRDVTSNKTSPSHHSSKKAGLPTKCTTNVVRDPVGC